MTNRKILVAASAGITAEAWMKRKLVETLGDPSCLEAIGIGGNKALSRSLHAMGITPEHWSTNATPRKSEIKKILSSVDYLLIFWDGRTMTDLIFEARLRNIATKVHPIEVTEIVNKERTDEYDAYIGRGTPWGNPYPVGLQAGQYTRDEAIEKYKKHFEVHILGDESKRRGLLGLRGMRLACHCKPLACHGDIIANYLNAIDPDESTLE